MKSLISYLLLLLALPLQAQVHQAWIARHTLATTGTNQPVTMALDRDGNILIGGHGTSTNGDYDYVALKYAPGGALLWQARYSGTGDDLVRSMKVDGEGNALLTGTSISVKWSTNGIEQWTAPYGGRGIAVDPSGDAYVAGFSETSYSTVKLHREAGTNMWLRTANVTPGKPDISQVIAVDSKSNIFVSGQVICYWDPRTAYANRRTVSYDADGGWRWGTATVPEGCRYNGADMRALMLGLFGELIEMGNMDGNTPTVRKLSSNGQVIWNEFLLYDLIHWTNLRAGCVDQQGFIYLAGEAIGSSGFPVKAYSAVAKMHPSGTNMWISVRQAFVPSPISHAVTVDDAGNVYATGQLPGTGTANDYATIKYSPAGQELWVQRYDGPAHGDDVATAIAVAPDGSVYVTGWSTTSSNLIEITTIKYTQSATLTVETNRTVSLQFPGTPGVSNRVQATTDFLGWLDVGFSVTDTNGLIHFLDTNAPAHPFRFYRTVAP